MSFRNNLIHLRMINNMTQEQLAMLLGVSRQSVAKWEAGNSYPEMDNLLSLCRIFNCSLDEIVQGDLTGREADEKITMASSVNQEDVFGYDEQMRSFASRVSNGVMTIIIGLAFLASFGSMGETFMPIGILAFCVGVVVGVGLIVSGVSSRQAFSKAHPFVEDFYTPEEKKRTKSQFVGELIGGIGLILCGICIVAFLAHSSLEATIGAPILLLLFAVGIRLIIHGWMTLRRTDLDTYNEKRVGAICSIIMMISSAAGLLLLFFGNWYFWLAWPIGALCCAAAAALAKGFKRTESTRPAA